MHIARTTVRARSIRFLAVLGLAGAAVVGVATPSSAGTPLTLTLSANQGPNNGGATITATTPVGTSPFFPGVDVEFQPATVACSNNYTAPTASNGVVDVPFVMLLAPNRIAINLPNFGSAALNTKYNVCVYSSPNTSGVLLAQTTSATGQFTIGARANVFSVWPPSGSAQGGTTITVTGSGFPTTQPAPPAAPALTATLGGLPLTVTLMSPTQFSAVTPAHAPGTLPVALVVTTGGGTTIFAKAFTYSNGITVSPATAPSTRTGGTAVYIQGAGFSALSFAMPGTVDDKNAHVYLVRGIYDPSSAGSTKRNGELVECASAMIISDTELLCTMYLQVSLTASGATAPPTARSVSGDTQGTTR
jgi:hypothetical protein